jgi:capsular exopolysaccharide synthesis family protein
MYDVAPWSPARIEGPTELPTDTISLRSLFLTLWRWKLLLLTLTLGGLALGHFTVQHLVPRYSAEAALLLDVPQVKVANVESGDSNQPKDNAAVRSQIDIIQSRSLAQRVVEALSLADDPEFNFYARPHPIGWLADHLPEQIVHVLPGEWQRWLQRSSPAWPAPDPGHQQSDVVTNVLSRLAALNDGKSYSIQLTFQSQIPEKAARILNKFTELYLVSQLEARYQATERASHWLESKRADLRMHVDEAERALQDYKEMHLITDLPNNGTLAIDQVTNISRDLMNTRSSRAQAEAQLREAQQLAKSVTQAASSPQVSMAPLIQTLRSQLISLERKHAEMSSIYGNKNPKLLSVEADLSTARLLLQQEVDRIVEGLKSQVTIERSREQNLEGQLRVLETTNQEKNRAAAGLRYLESEAAAARSVLQTFVTGIVATSAQSGYQSSDARVLSAAETPTHPSFPSRILLMSLFAVAGVLISLTIIFLSESLDDKIRGTEEAESFLGVPVLGGIPRIPSLRRHSKDPSAYALANPFSPYAEAVRSVDVTVHASDVDHPPKVLLITSPLPGDGKSSFATTMARLAAAMGRHVLLVDCDFRYPSIGKLLDAAPGPGLLEVLLGETSLEDAGRVDRASGMSFIPIGSQAHGSKFPIELLHSRRMADLARHAAERFDLVIFDCPPIGLVHDALVLADYADAILMVVRWGTTRKAVARTALRKFTASNYKVTGVVLSQVDVARHAGYGYGDQIPVYPKKYLST